MTDQYISTKIDNVWFVELIDDWLRFSPNDTTEFDAAMAMGYALMMTYNPQYNPKQKETKQIPIEDYFSFMKGKRTGGIFGKYS